MQADTTFGATDVNAPLKKFLGRRLPPSESSVPIVHRETTICYAYMCPYAYGCTEKSRRPAQVLKRRCMRYQPEDLRIEPGVTEHALDMLARYRQEGKKLTPVTRAILDELRPEGPVRGRV